ncbi:MAG: hypothetical protein KC620_21000 [Myxococcales bacterium]|nr:hypothetical protein [Myxococcales bacterium]
MLLCHLGMTGKWLHRDAAEPARAGTRLRLGLDDGGWLHFVDPRRFGQVRLIAAADEPTDAAIAGLGPDVLALCAAPGGLAGRLAGVKRAIKVALLDQGRLAGVGNIYAAEALWRARIDPFRLANTLSDDNFARLAMALAATMAESLDRERDDEITYLQDAASQNPFDVYGRAGKPCRVCEAAIERAVQQGRSTFFCRACQAVAGAKSDVA